LPVPDPLRLVVLTPERTLLDVADVRKVRVLLADEAWLSVYPGHAPLLAETVAGSVAYVTDAGEDDIDLAEGIVRIEGGVVTLFTGGLAGAADMLHADAEDDALEFDRLAQVLMVTLGAHTGEVLASEGGGT
jgi:F0F1-type ATP synthase epsilon subunit